MPASYRIDLRAGVVFTLVEGHVTNEELLAHQQRMSADPDFRPTMNHVIDARAVSSIDDVVHRRPEVRIRRYSLLLGQ